MRHAEMVQLVAFVAQLNPAQRIDEFTADAWHHVIGDLDFTEALDAIRAVARRQQWVAPCDIVAEVRTAHRERLEAADRAFLPVTDPDDVVEYRRELVEHRRSYALSAGPAPHPRESTGSLPELQRVDLRRTLAIAAAKAAAHARRSDRAVEVGR